MHNSVDCNGTEAVMLQVSNLSKTYPNGVKVLKDISFSLENGGSTSIIGSNGSGKSTLLRCLLRLIEPDSGSVKMFGSELSTAKKRELRKIRSQVGFVFQKHNLVSKLSVLSNVLHGNLSKKSSPRNWYHSFATKEAREEAMECLKMVGLEDLARRGANEISGGQSQRVAIARALMQKPKVIFADEPVASLDPKNGEEVMELFTKLSREQNITLVFVSHNIDHAIGYSERVLGMKDGMLDFNMLTSEINRDEIGALYG